MTHTKDKLAEALRAVDLEDMAMKAAEGYYHDYLSPLDFPEITLVQDLLIAGMNRDETLMNKGKILSLRDRVIDGEFDASKEESDEWMASPEGQEAFSKLVGGK